MPRGNVVIGLDLGMVYDHCALAVVERFQRMRDVWLGGQVREDVHHVVYLYRWDLGTAYRQVVSEVGQFMQKADLQHAAIVFDGTSVGRDVALLLHQAHREGRLGNFWPRGYVITGGREITDKIVPKRELIVKALTLLESGRLKIADELTLRPQLEREFLAMRVKTTPAGHDSYEAARERDHDDILFAVMLASWFQHSLTQPRLLEAVQEGANATT